MELRNKKVTVMGLGLHGGGAAVVLWLVRHGARVTVTDLKTKHQLAASMGKLKGVNVTWVLGRHRMDDFTKTDLLIKNPGVPDSSPYLIAAKKAGVPIDNDASLFLKHCRASVVGVTGTRGKSTTASLVSCLLAESGSSVHLAGLSQKPLMTIADRAKKQDIAVAEFSSWQLEVTGSNQVSPHVAVVTNIFPDHLNRYSSMAAYIAAKCNIFKFQTPQDISVLNYDDVAVRKMGRIVPGQRLWFSKKSIGEQNGAFVSRGSIVVQKNGRRKVYARVSDSALPGAHNISNVLAAVAAASVFPKVTPRAVVKALKSFKGLPGRIELIRKYRGVAYYNDTTSTIPDATMAALATLGGKKTALIVGGDFKKIPDSKYRDLARSISQHCSAVVVFPGKGSAQLKKFLRHQRVVYDVPSMADAVGVASSLVTAGGAVLLSPACASFNMFANEFDRGDQFNAAVAEL